MVGTGGVAKRSGADQSFKLQARRPATTAATRPFFLARCCYPTWVTKMKENGTVSLTSGLVGIFFFFQKISSIVFDSWLGK
jgi:hypothetical protein